MSHPFNYTFKKAGAARTLLVAVTLTLVAACGVWYAVRNGRTEKPPVSLKDLPKGRMLAVSPVKGYEPKLTEAESKLLRDGPDANDKRSVKAYLLARAKLEENPIVRSFYEQHAVFSTEGYGVIPAIEARNPQVSSVIEALKTGKHPERLNPLIAPKPFDASAYRSDRKAYLDTAEPGRVFQRLPDSAAEAPFIRPVTPFSQDVRQGESVTITVKAAPGYPVTFTSFDAGAFENGLTTMTVEADAGGAASVRFLGMPGTVLASNILAASPMSRGQARFQMNTLVRTDTPAL